MTPMSLLGEVCGLRRRFSPFVLPAALALVCILSARAAAQGLPGLPVPSATGLPLPPGVRQEGLYLTAPVLVDGVPLFRIASRANAGANQLSVQTRAAVIEAALTQLLASRGGKANSGTVYNPRTLRIDVKSEGFQPVIETVDAAHTTPLPILTVTAADTQYYAEPNATLARQWRATLQDALVRALDKRQPAVFARNVRDLWRIGVVFALITVAIVAALVALQRRLAALAAGVKADELAIDNVRSASIGEEPAPPGLRRRFLGLAVRAADPAMTLTVLRGTRGMLIWILVLLWFAGLVWALSLFPQTTPLGAAIFQRATRIAFTWICAALLMRIVAFLVAHAARTYGKREPIGNADEHARRLLRVPTIANTSVAVTAFVVYFVAVLATLSHLGISTGSVLTLGGLVALAISLAAQNLVRDFLNGFLVLVEDQYVVGDRVTIGDRSGVVEHMTLRIVQLRDGSGSLVTIPHGEVTEVVNSSRK